MCSPFCTLPAKPVPESTLAEQLGGPVPRWRGWHVVLILVFWALIYLPGMFHPALLDDADSTHAEAAREMVMRHDWVTMYMNGIRYLEKAPLMYWAVALSFKMFGFKDWAARAPLVLSVLALLFVTYSFGRRAFRDANAGFFSALVLATAVGPYLFTRVLIPDIAVGLWMALGLLFFFESLQQARPSRAVCWGFAVTAALNVLTKGLIGIAFPCGVVFFYLLITRNLKHLRKLRLVSSTLIFLAIAAPWHILAQLANPATGGQQKGFLWFYFVNEQFLRYLNKRFPYDYTTIPLYLFWGLMLVWLVPWSAFLPQAIREVRVRLRGLADGLDRRGRANLLFAVWALLVLIFFSFSSRQEYYVVPIYPAVALLIGGWLGREAAFDAPASLRRAGRISAAVLFVTGIAAAIVAALLMREAHPPAPGYDLADLLAEKPSQAYSMSMGHFLDLTPAALGAFRGLIIGVGLSMLIGAGVAWWLRRRSAVTASNVVLGAMMVGVLYCSHVALVRFAPVLSSHDLAVAVNQQLKPDDVIEVYGEYESASTMNYYTGREIRVYNPIRTANLWFGSIFSDAPRLFDDGESFLRIWNGPQRVFLWTNKKDGPPELRQGRSVPAYVLKERGGKEILCNRPL